MAHLASVQSRKYLKKEKARHIMVCTFTNSKDASSADDKVSRTYCLDLRLLLARHGPMSLCIKGCSNGRDLSEDLSRIELGFVDPRQGF